ncbi:hypothetical protein AV530_004230 [Patagioenas fasciata monilis]|uniref:Uncharacterized protein n=1 Tax=Patagioenas fasciata monilis TaxID=372326 RepID=A0A1V4K8L6_PATFA|nr:hypothetical protein AV530_004230 [Patagioenas fasciata monilis]
MLVHRRSNMDGSKVPRRAPVCSNLSQELQQPLVELWQNWRGPTCLDAANELSADWHCGWSHSHLGFLQGRSPSAFQGVKRSLDEVTVQ